MTKSRAQPHSTIQFHGCSPNDEAARVYVENGTWGSNGPICPRHGNQRLRGIA